MLEKWLKRIGLGLVVLFALFYLIARPEEAADAVRSAIGFALQAIRALITFFNELTG